MKIAIIDSGINIQRLQTTEHRIKQINTELYCKDNKDNIGHGTAIAYIFSKMMPQLEIISFKLFDTNHITTEDEIISILEEIYKNYRDIDIIHISNGVTYISKYQNFYDICDRLCKRGQIIISAYDNEGSISYPAAFDNTIGVYWDKRVRNTKEYFYIKNSSVEILGYAGNQRLPWKEDDYVCVSGSSFAAPYITLQVAKYKTLNPKLNLDMIREQLENDAKKVITLPYVDKRNEQKEKIEEISKIKKAIIFPCNKETISILANSDMVKFEIIGIFDYNYSSYLKKNTIDFVFGESVVELIVNRFEDIDWTMDFDTIIIGHLGIVNSITKLNYNKIILEKCEDYNKNCFFFDKINNKENEYLVEKIVKNGNYVMSHHIKNINISNFPCGSYHKLSSPTLAIVGTSPRQGKYNLQLSLRRRFLNDGYDVGQIGTEPSSLLLGMDIGFSNGYENQYNISSEQEILYLNESIFRIGKKDIVIMGTQSNTIPMHFGNIGFLTNHQQNTLVALEPDCSILCVNYDDDVDYIERTIKVLQNYYLTTVIGIVVFPFHRKIEWNINNVVETRTSIEQEIKIKKIFSHTYGIKTYINGKKDDMDDLYNECITFFTKNM